MRHLNYIGGIQLKGIILFSLATFNSSCGSSSSDSPVAVSSAPSQASIQEDLESDDYLTWTGDATVRDDAGPHGKIRSFINSILEDSIAANNTVHTIGSISVKELYSSDGATLNGLAYFEKITTGSDVNSWVWYEDLDITNDDVDIYGVGHSSCAPCHSKGTDYVTYTR